MCHPGLPLVALSYPARRRVRVRVRVRAEAEPVEDASARAGAAPAGATACSSVTAKVCICSPTAHPGSFRCRRHRAGYRWRGGAKAS